jgi:hypothetical protein
MPAGLHQAAFLKQKQSYSEQNEDYVYSIKSIGIGRDGTATGQISGDLDLTLDCSEYLDSSARILKVKEGYMVRTIYNK